jgi:hypothetical protein
VAVDPQHICVTQPAIGVPILDRAVPPCAIDQPERGEIDNEAQLLRVNADSVAEQFADELAARKRWRNPGRGCPGRSHADRAAC